MPAGRSAIHGGTAARSALQKNAEDTKSGAGQCFTARAIVACVCREPMLTISDPACGTGGFFLGACNWLKDDSLDSFNDLPPPEMLQQEIIDHLEAALAAFRDVAAAGKVRRRHMDHTQHLVQFSYGLAFMTGILGSGHCLGMCGSLVSGFFMKLGANSTGPYLAYHAARVLVYGLIGLTAASLGAVLVQTGIVGKAQGLLQILAGIVVILLGLDLLGVSPLRNRLGFAPLAWVRRRFVDAGRRGPVAGAAIGGALNGLMPCSMTMALAVQATTAPGPAEGALLMFAFGAGTLPSMLAASVLFGRLGVRTRGWLLRGAAIFVIVLGLSTLWQGISYYMVMRNLANW